jgi:hypothetical protein
MVWAGSDVGEIGCAVGLQAEVAARIKMRMKSPVLTFFTAGILFEFEIYSEEAYR